MNVRGYQFLPSAPPALSACIYCKTPVVMAPQPLPCGCVLPLHRQCQQTMLLTEVGCPVCRQFWITGVGSSATSVISVAGTPRPSPSCASCECSPWWSVYVLAVLIVGIGVLYLLFHYVIE
jgi:hypothetical protein